MIGGGTILVATTTGPRPVVALVEVGDWAVGESLRCNGHPHVCGGCTEGPGYTVTYIPTGKALAKHIPDHGDARTLAHMADFVCPKGADHALHVPALTEAALRFGAWKGVKS